MSLNLSKSDLVVGGPPVNVSVTFLRQLGDQLPGAAKMIADHLCLETAAEVYARAERGELAASDLPTRELLDALGLMPALEEAAKELEPWKY